MTDLPSETDALTENPDEWKYDLAVDIILAIGVALNVYFIVDVATDGQLSRDVAASIRRFRARTRVHIGVLLHRDAVIEEAHEALYIEETEEP